MSIEKDQRTTIFTCLLLLIGSVMLAWQLRADGPADISRSAGAYFDPPSKCHNARNLALHGEWSTDEWNPYIHSPLYTAIQAVVFRIAGVGLAQMRLASVLVSILALLLIYLLARGEHGPPWGLLALGLAAGSYAFLMFGRSALLEPFAMFFMLASTGCIRQGYGQADRDPDGRVSADLWMAAAGLLAGLAFLSKATAGVFAAAALLTFLLFPPRRRAPVAFFVLLLAVPIVFYFGVFMRANLGQFQREGGYWMSRAGGTVLDVWIRQPLFLALQHTVLPMIAACLALGWFRNRAAAHESRARHISTVLMVFTLVLWSQFLACVDYRPSRYYVPLLGPAFLLATSLAAYAHRWLIHPSEVRERSLINPFLRFVALSFVLKFAVINPIVVSMPRQSRLTHMQRMGLACLAALVLVLLLHFLQPRIAVAVSRIRMTTRKRAFAALLLLLLAFYFRQNMPPYLRWARRPPRVMFLFGRRLDAAYRKATIAGISPLFAVMENRHAARKVTHYHLNWPSFFRDEITHLVLPSQLKAHEKFFEKTFSHRVASRTRVESVEISGRPHVLYALALRPLEIRTTARPGHVAVQLSNPDSHTPQTACFAVLPSDEGSTDPLTCVNLELLPEDMQTIDLPIRTGSLLCSFPRSAWRDACRKAHLHGSRRVEDAGAWNLHAIRLTGSRSGRQRSGHVSVSLQDPRHAVYIGVRLRGQIEAGDLTLEWRAGEDILYVPLLRLGTHGQEAYRPIILPVPPSITEPGDELRLVLNGRGEIFVDAFLASDREMLDAGAIEISQESTQPTTPPPPVP